MNNPANDSVPLAVRGFLLVLVAFLHVAGAAALTHLSEPMRHDEEPSILRASWIEDPVSSPLPLLPAMQPAKPLPVARSAPSPIQPRVRAPSQPQPPAVQSASVPVAVDTAPAVPVVQDDSAPAPSIDVFAAIGAAVAGGTIEESKDERGSGGNYVGPNFNVSYFSNPEPEYPSQSRRLREQGLVKLRVHVTEQGRTGEVALHKSSGYNRLDKAAMDAVWRWRFHPAQRAGTPVAGWVVVPIRFELQG